MPLPEALENVDSFKGHCYLGTLWVITFCLSCLLACSICIVFTVAMVAGLAYGYNYSMAEFLTFKRSDVTVYMRRGQFQDFPDLSFNQNPRRSGDENDAFSANITSDYQEQKFFNNVNDTELIAKKWEQAQDTRKYAEKITKYSGNKKSTEESEDMSDETVEASMDSVMPTGPPDRFIAILSNRAMVDTRRDTTEMFIKKLTPTENNRRSDVKTSPDSTFMGSYEKDNKKWRVNSEDDNDAATPDIRILVDDKPNSGYVPMHYWDTSTVTAHYYSNDDIDEEVAYKPV